MQTSTRPNVALVGPEIEENLSLRYIAATLERQGVTTTIHPYQHEDEMMAVLADIEALEPAPVMVGLSLAFQWRATDILSLAMALKERGYAGHITAGGHFATFAADELMKDFPELDSICRQEAEETVSELCQAVIDQTPLDGIAGLSYRREQNEEGPTQQSAVVHNELRAVPDLAKLPWPDRRGEPAEAFGHKIAPLVGSRGCYANCTFCCIAAWHEQALPGKRWRAREVDDVADEMAWLQREKGTEIFVFHDDNFFLPRSDRNYERFSALADALDARGVTRFATIVKARPNDIKPDVVKVLKERLRCVRAYVGVETDSEQGLHTLGRWAKRDHNAEAIDRLRAVGLFTCFNILLFDPDTTMKSLEENLTFMEATADFPFNFGRVELYAGTPLLGRMLLEGRARGDYLQWNYSMTSPVVEEVFKLANKVFHGRNFAPGALANGMMGVRFDIECCAHFHPELFDAAWRARGIKLTEQLGRHSVAILRRIMATASSDTWSKGPTNAARQSFIDEVKAEVDAVDAELKLAAGALVREVHAAVGAGRPVSDYASEQELENVLKDTAATPLQDASRVS